MVGPSFFSERAPGVTVDDVRRVVDKEAEIRRRFLASGRLRRMLDDAVLLLQLVKDYWGGRYRQIPYFALASIVVALLYVFAPLDLLPDAVPLLGVVDDAAVMALCLGLVREEIQKYRTWLGGP